jgi:hypothetical protein
MIWWLLYLIDRVDGWLAALGDVVRENHIPR